MNEESHWDSIGANYSTEIFDVFTSDRKKLLPQYFEKHANKGSCAVDFGCGTGKAFPYLAPVFKEVLALDISSKLLALAKTRPFENISFKRMDLSKPNLILPSADFIFCCNVIMLPEISKNEAMIQNIQRTLSPDGTALIVLPSLDSILFSTWRLIDWYRKEGVSPRDIPAAELSYFKGPKRNLLQGIVHIDGVRTKHYGYAELEVMFEHADLEITALKRLEYNWNTEFSAPPKWMNEPYPWDWLIECKKMKRA